MKLTRKELAEEITQLRGDRVTVRQVRSNEERWGLKKARGVDINCRVVRYEKSVAIAILRKIGIV